MRICHRLIGVVRHILVSLGQMLVERGNADRRGRDFFQVSQPFAHMCPLDRVVGRHRMLRIDLFQVFEDYRGIDDHVVAVRQRRHHPVGVQFQVPLAQMFAVLVIDMALLERNPFFPEGEAHFLAAGRLRKAVEREVGHVRFSLFDWILRATPQESQRVFKPRGTP